MKRYLTALLALVVITTGLHAQKVTPSVTPSVIASAGGSGTVGGVTVMWTVGEVAVTTLRSPAGYITQGFHQPPPGTSDVPFEAVASEGMNLYPNPASRAITLNLPATSQGSLVNVSVVDLVGREVMQSVDRNGNGTMSFDVSTLPAGTYIVRVGIGEDRYSRILTVRR